MHCGDGRDYESGKIEATAMRRYLATEGQYLEYEDYELPWWYAVIRAAKWLGVHPEEMANTSTEWLSRVLVVAEAEAHAEEVRSKQRR